MQIRIRLVVVTMTVVAVMTMAACTHSSHPAAAGSPRPPSPATSAPPLTSPGATSISQQLASGNDASLRSAVAIPSGQKIDPSAIKQLAAIGPITFDLSTFRYIDPMNATVIGHVAHPPAGTSSTWTFTLTYVASVWKLLDGEPQ